MKTLVIDNHDSFTYNLVHQLARINQEPPVVVLNDEVTWDELEGRAFDNIVISPGPGRPDRVRDFGVSRDAILHATVPILGVCLGHQGVLSTLSETSVKRAPTPVHGRVSSVFHTGTDLFEGLPSPFAAARYHSLIVPSDLPAAFERTAWTSDSIVMGIAHTTRAIWGVQFHPESIITEYGDRMMSNFRDLSRARCPTVRVATTRTDGRPDESAPARRSGVPNKTTWRSMAGAVPAEAAFVNLFGEAASAFWLDSSLASPGLSRWSYMGDAAGPHSERVEYSVRDGIVRVGNHSGKREFTMSVFDYLAGNLGPAPEESPPCPFVGGYLGWFGYELRHDRRSATTRRAGTPDAQFVMVDRFIAIDHEASETYVVAVHDGAGAEAARCWVDRIMSRLRDLPVPSAPAPGGNADRPLKFFLHRDRSRYMADIRQCLDWIRCGEAYQICLTNEITCEVTHDPLALYRVMRDVNPAPFAAFLRWPGGAVLSASPERFLAVDRNGRVETKPIKGTIRRDSDPIADRRLAAQLRHSEKDRAENVMIVDLLRNDLSRVCVPGSVVVSKLFDVETYATVHQLVSTVRGELGLGRTSVDLVRATFPGGSMTGAPKLRALDLIDELEGRARGIYSGAIGWLGSDGAMDLSIAIRTAVSTGNRLSMGVGGGVVAQSTPAGEFDEMVLKAAASIKAIVTAVCGFYDPALADVDTIDGTSMTRQSGS